MERLDVAWGRYWLQRGPARAWLSAERFHSVLGLKAPCIPWSLAHLAQPVQLCHWGVMTKAESSTGM